MTLADLATGPTWPGYLIVALLAALALLLLSGRGSWLIAGYNTAPEEKKALYDAKKLCRVTGFGVALVDLLILLMLLFEDVIPAAFAPVFGGAMVLIIAGILVVCNTVCKKKR